LYERGGLHVIGEGVPEYPAGLAAQESQHHVLFPEMVQRGYMCRGMGLEKSLIEQGNICRTKLGH